MNQTKKALVIGSGVGGLASAIRLSQKGYEVEVLEANSYAGGKVTVVEGGGFRFDAGPSLFTLPHLVDELFALCGENPRDHFNYVEREVACHYFWPDGTFLKAYTDSDRFAKEVEEVLHFPQHKLKAYLQRAKEVYEGTHRIFLERSLHKLDSYLDAELFKALSQMHKMGLWQDLHRFNEQQLGHPKLVQLFDRFATYNGSSPYKTPGTMHMIAHLEHNMGSYQPKGGMHSITTSLKALAERQGVKFRFNSKVERFELEKDRVLAAQLQNERLAADLFVSNMDVVPTYRQLMPDLPAPEHTLQQQRSSSALIFYWGIRRRFPQLDLHNIFFSPDYEEEFKSIFEKEDVSTAPTIYVNISSVENPEDAPEGCENWFVMINVPSNTGQDWDALTARLRSYILQRLSRELEVNLADLIDFEETLDPRSIESKTSSFQGALYGAASNNRMAAFMRHPNFSRRIPNLYFAGGSVHPGGGVPLALLSGKIVGGLVPELKSELKV